MKKTNRNKSFVRHLLCSNLRAAGVGAEAGSVTFVASSAVGAETVDGVVVAAAVVVVGSQGFVHTERLAQDLAVTACPAPPLYPWSRPVHTTPQ
jgi:hypothetical protein